MQSLYHTFHRYRTLQTHHITALPIVILMPHSACNCRCIMCDIWKGNKNLKQLTEEDVSGLLKDLRKLGTRQVVMSGGEAMLNPLLFSFCRILKNAGMKITLLSTGLTLKQNSEEILKWVDDIIVSLDGPEDIHDRIRNVPGAFFKLKQGVQSLKSRNAQFKVTARTVIHRLNYKHWPDIIKSAKDIGLDQISFLPADVSSHAFNREILWNSERQNEVLIPRAELPLLTEIIESLISGFRNEFESGFIAESPEKLKNIGRYYGAIHGLNAFPFKKCNAPWVSAVVEADGTIKPCFFHKAYGNIREGSFGSVINRASAKGFRKSLSLALDDTCKRCVCSLHLSPLINPAKI